MITLLTLLDMIMTPPSNFNLPDNRHYSHVSLHINTSVVSSLGSIGKFYKNNFSRYKHRLVIFTFWQYDILVKCLFLSNTRAKGVFLALMYLNENNEIDFSRSLYTSIEVTMASKGIAKNVSQGTYRVLAFDIEEDNQIQKMGLPATMTTIAIEGKDIGLFESCIISIICKYKYIIIICSVNIIYITFLSSGITFEFLNNSFFKFKRT